MATSMYIFKEVDKGKDTAVNLRVHIHNMFRDDEELYSTCERYLMPPGVEGAKSFDQAEVARLVKECSIGYSATRNMKDPLASIPARTVWDLIYSVLRKAGFKMQHGRIMGLLENLKPKDEPVEEGQPDIE